jgi:GntR family transcriptional regulator/MocR family aminotransferase
MSRRQTQHAEQRVVTMRRSAAPNVMLDSTDGTTLQDQIRQRIVDAAISGSFPAGCKLPSSRELARQLGVSRNTVVQAYQKLIAAGFLVSRPRSGLFIDQDVMRASAQDNVVVRAPRQGELGADWSERLRGAPTGESAARPIPNWLQYPYPFLDGLYDPSLFPVTEWRETDRLSLSLANAQFWSVEAGDADDEHFVDEIRAKLLMRRGVLARSDEILITVGAQHARYLAARLLMDRTTPVGLEEPGEPVMRGLVQAQGAPMIHQPVDDEGIVVDERLSACKAIYVTPSRQVPTGVTLSIERRRELLSFSERRDIVLIEDDSAYELPGTRKVLPPLRALDHDDRVIYIGSLARVLTPALQLGFIVGPSPFIAAARRLRSLSVRHPPRLNQRAAALFMSLGHYDATLLRLRRAIGERRTALFDALDFYLPSLVTVENAQGGPSYWVRFSGNVSARALAQEAERHGILIEPVDSYYAMDDKPVNVIRMSATGVPLAKIRPGVAVLAQLIRNIVGPRTDAEWTAGDFLVGRKLRAAMSGARILYKTVYGEPSVIELHRDGTMGGQLGFANEERDTGTWNVKGDLWYRQWRSWGYGESLGFRIAVKGDRIAWFSAAGRLIETAILARR